jgi:glycyl-tRNA synthetase
MADRVDSVVNLCKRRGFVFPSSEIYGGTRSAWDYGPNGVELKENVRRQWWQHMVRGRDDVVGIDSSIILAGLGGLRSRRCVRGSTDRVQEMP